MAVLPKNESREKRRREASTCAPEELVATSWEWEADEIFDEIVGPVELRRQLVEEAEEYLRRYPKPPLEEVVEEILQDDPFRPADFGAPDSTTLVREERER